jgi:hypothetical protein
MHARDVDAWLRSSEGNARPSRTGRVGLDYARFEHIAADEPDDADAAGASRARFGQIRDDLRALERAPPPPPPESVELQLPRARGQALGAAQRAAEALLSYGEPDPIPLVSMLGARVGMSVAELDSLLEKDDVDGAMEQIFGRLVAGVTLADEPAAPAAQPAGAPTGSGSLAARAARRAGALPRAPAGGGRAAGGAVVVDDLARISAELAAMKVKAKQAEHKFAQASTAAAYAAAHAAALKSGMARSEADLAEKGRLADAAVGGAKQSIQAILDDEAVRLRGIEALREKARRALRVRKPHVAIMLYTDALGACATGHEQATLLASRAHAYATDGAFALAAEDALGAARASPTWAKAHFRRAHVCEQAGLRQLAGYRYSTLVAAMLARADGALRQAAAAAEGGDEAEEGADPLARLLDDSCDDEREAAARLLSGPGGWQPWSVESDAHVGAARLRLHAAEGAEGEEEAQLPLGVGAQPLGARAAAAELLDVANALGRAARAVDPTAALRAAPRCAAQLKLKADELWQQAPDRAAAARACLPLYEHALARVVQAAEGATSGERACAEVAELSALCTSLVLNRSACALAVRAHGGTRTLARRAHARDSPLTCARLRARVGSAPRPSLPRASVHS